MSGKFEPSSPILPVAIDSSSVHDRLYERAVHLVLDNRLASVALLQRNLSLGYSVATGLMKSMEEAGVVSQALAADGLREILLSEEQRQKLLAELDPTGVRNLD